MVIGAGVALFAGHQMLSKALQPGHEMATHLTRRIERKLDLTDAQKIQVQKIVDERVAAFRGILGDVYPDILEQFELLRTEVGRLLTEEQKIKWEAHYRKIREKVLSHMPPSQVQKDKPE
jgi:adenylate kinase family enzyme